ncbi:MAG TPA: 2-phospho-L-lactate transferase [Candidatus Dormibacteraeota bacterium]|jgi:LPPG:FO 2-phospho-L-lactate transferase|nr:2-phospho-L-lactate transferase [Candidatus Dormibacteraeota bacterium]
MKVTLLAGGTGGARLAGGFQELLAPGDLSIVTNPGDDLDHWGLRICPDTDAVLFRLGGIFDEARGYGVVDDTSAVLDQMGRLGESTWFHLGDRDLAFHVFRTARLSQGRRLTDVIAELSRRLGIASHVLPATDDSLRTFFVTDRGRLSFQEYFVRERLHPKLEAIEFDGLEQARPAPEARAAVEEADLVVIGPSNPLISIGPILSLLGPCLRPERTVAVTPLVGGRALKGPTAEMLRLLRGEATPERVAAEYRGQAGWFVLDAVDEDRRAQVEAVGCRVLVADTVMRDRETTRALAGRIMAGIMDAEAH